MVPIKDLSAYEPFLEAAIDRHPLVVSPDTPLSQVVVLMSQTRGISCAIFPMDETAETLLQEARSSCVLVMQATELLGIFTERDIVRLTAADTNLAELTIGQVMIQPVITLPKSDFCSIFAALFLFRRHQIRHLVIVDDDRQLIGIVSPETIRQVLKPTNLLKLRRVNEVMITQVIHAKPTTPVIHLARQMANHRVSCVVVVEGNEAWPIEDPSSFLDQERLPVLLPIGIVTERDLVQFQALGLDLAKTTAHEVMSSPLFLASPEDSLWTAHQEMQRRRVQRLVVSWNWGTRLGLVTQTSLLRVFDPVEMYGVIETLQQSLQGSEEAILATNLVAKRLGDQGSEDDASQHRSPEVVAAVDESTSPPTLNEANQPSSCLSQPDVNLRLINLQMIDLQNCLEKLADHPELSSPSCRGTLHSAIADLQKIIAALPLSHI